MRRRDGVNTLDVSTPSRSNRDPRHVVSVDSPRAQSLPRGVGRFAASAIPATWSRSIRRERNPRHVVSVDRRARVG